MPLRIGVLTISDRAAAGSIQDEGGPSIISALSETWTVARTAVIPDEKETIAHVLIEWCDEDALDVVFTTGGTGLSARDVTPEATRQVAEREVPGIAESIRSKSLEQTPFAMISRGEAVVRGRTLIVNLPGSPRGAREGVQVVLPVLEHAVSVLRGANH